MTPTIIKLQHAKIKHSQQYAPRPRVMSEMDFFTSPDNDFSATFNDNDETITRLLGIRN